LKLSILAFTTIVNAQTSLVGLLNGTSSGVVGLLDGSSGNVMDDADVRSLIEATKGFYTSDFSLRSGRRGVRRSSTRKTTSRRTTRVRR